jgi:hypothetical protein
MQMSPRWIVYLNDVAVLPAIRLGISRRNLNVGSLGFGSRCIHPEASILLGR